MRYPRTEWAAGISRAGLQRALSDLGFDSGATKTQLEALEARIAALEAAAGGSTASLNAQTVEFSWIFGSLQPYQAVTEEFGVLGLETGTPLIVNTASDTVWLLFWANCSSPGRVRVTAFNSGDNPIAASTIPLRLTYFTHA